VSAGPVDLTLGAAVFFLGVLVAVVGWLARAVARLDRTVAGLAVTTRTINDLERRTRAVELEIAALSRS